MMKPVFIQEFETLLNTFELACTNAGRSNLVLSHPYIGDLLTQMREFSGCNNLQGPKIKLLSKTGYQNI